MRSQVKKELKDAAQRVIELILNTIDEDVCIKADYYLSDKRIEISVGYTYFEWSFLEKMKESTGYVSWALRYNNKEDNTTIKLWK